MTEAERWELLENLYTIEIEELEPKRNPQSWAVVWDIE